MDKLEDIKALLQHIRSSEGEYFEVDENSVFTEYQKRFDEKSSLIIKVLSVFGGILASLAFLGFLFILGLYDSKGGMLAFGIGFIVIALWLSNRFDKLVIDTFSVSIYVLGFILLIFALFSFDLHEDTISFLVMAIAALCLLITKNYILSFISILTIGAVFLALIISNDLYEAIQVYVVLYAFLLAYVFISEPKLLTWQTKTSKLYYPVRIGLIFSFLFGLVALGKNGLVPVSHNTIWISSLVIILVVLYLIGHLAILLGIKSKQDMVRLYAFSSIMLLPTLFAPAISGALLIVLLSFMANYKTGLGIGIIALVYFVVQYYYDLNFTLLTKSIILFASGLVFLFFYWFLTKKFQINEKV